MADLFQVDAELMAARNILILSRNGLESLYSEIKASKAFGAEDLCNAAIGGLFEVEHRLDAMQKQLDEMRKERQAA